MTTISLLQRLYDSVFWADDRALDSVVGTDDPEPRRYLHHVLAAERVWLLRLRGEDSSTVAIWPELSDDDARSLAAENRGGYQRYLSNIREGDLERVVEYVNQVGRRYRTSVVDILTHVATHGAYHRGQLARALRQAGGVPQNTDFIAFVREQDEVIAELPPV